MSNLVLHPEDQECEHASSDDFRRVFIDHVGSLYHLSFLLMGNRHDAERCFVAAVHETVNEKSVPKHSVRSRAKRAIVEQAIRVLNPRPEKKSKRQLPLRTPSDTDYLQTLSGRRAVIHRVLSLCVFERFVFVLCLLERHSVEQCARLLNCCIEDVIRGRTRALVQIAFSGAAVDF